jgi:hypothetical protein
MPTLAFDNFKLVPSLTSHYQFIVYNPSIPPASPKKDINIPDGHVIVGIALELNSRGEITWVDFKTCPAW